MPFHLLFHPTKPIIPKSDNRKKTNTPYPCSHLASCFIKEENAKNLKYFESNVHPVLPEDRIVPIPFYFPRCKAPVKGPQRVEKLRNTGSFSVQQESLVTPADPFDTFMEASLHSPVTRFISFHVSHFLSSYKPDAICKWTVYRNLTPPATTRCT